jgi:hypothetical protein
VTKEGLSAEYGMRVVQIKLIRPQNFDLQQTIKIIHWYEFKSGQEIKNYSLRQHMLSTNFYKIKLLCGHNLDSLWY